MVGIMSTTINILGMEELPMNREYIEKNIKNTFIDFLSADEFLGNTIVLSKAQGPYVWDINGKQYYDAIGGVFCASLGHSHPRLVEAARKQMETLTLSSPLYTISDKALELVEKMSAVTPGNLNYIKTFSGGSESIEAALKFVRQYYKQTGKPDKMKVITNYLSYHGATFGAMSAGGSPRKGRFEPQMPGFLKAYNPKQLRDDFGSWEETCRYSAKLIEKMVIAEIPDTIGAILIEPICNTAGIITPTKEYYEIIRGICGKYDIKLIFDEVLTGWGKTGDMFAAQTYGVTPDLICSGKGLSSGLMPLGAMIADEKMGEVFDGPAESEKFFMHGHTYAGNPLAAAVGMEVISIIQEENLIDNVRKLSPYLFERLEGLKKLGIIREIRGKGFLIGVEFNADAVPNKTYGSIGEALKRTAPKNGLLMRINPDWFAIAPALNATKEQLDELCDKIEVSVKDALACR